MMRSVKAKKHRFRDKGKARVSLWKGRSTCLLSTEKHIDTLSMKYLKWNTLPTAKNSVDSHEGFEVKCKKGVVLRHTMKLVNRAFSSGVQEKCAVHIVK